MKIVKRLHKHLLVAGILIAAVMCAGTFAVAESGPTPPSQAEIDKLLERWKTSEDGVLVHFFGTLADKAARPYTNLIAIISGQRLAKYEGANSTNLGKRKQDVYCSFPLLHNLFDGGIPPKERDAWIVAERDGLIDKELENYYMVLIRVGPPSEVWKPQPTTDMIVANVIHRGPTEPGTLECSPVVMRSLGLTPLFSSFGSRTGSEQIRPPTKVKAFLVKKGELITAVFDKQFQYPSVIISLPLGE